jgi:hypothetical protein
MEPGGFVDVPLSMRKINHLNERARRHVDAAAANGVL